MKIMKFFKLDKNFNLIKKKIDISHKDILKKQNFILGYEVKKLEKLLAKFVGSKYCVTVNSGTDALLISLMCIGVKPKDEIIVPAFGWISASEVVKILGAVPVYVDVKYDTCNIDENKIQKKITNKTKAIIPISLFGNPTNSKVILKIAKKNDLIVIDDFAQSMGSKVSKIKSGNLYQLNCTSFFPTKPLGSMGDGGAIFTNNSKYYHKIKAIRNHGQIKKYSYKFIGINSRLDTVNASFLIKKLSIFKNDLNFRKSIFQKYNSLLARFKNINLPVKILGTDSAYSVYTIKLKKRLTLIKNFKKYRIPYNIYYPKPLSEIIIGKNKDKNFPVAKRLCKEVISLPINDDIFNSKNLHKLIKSFKDV